MPKLTVKTEDDPVRLSKRDYWVIAGISVGGLPLLGVVLGILTWFMRRK
jgi:hypothetical protein